MELITTPETLLTHLDLLDIKLWLDGERLRYSAPPGALTPDLRAQLQTHKSELIALLRSRQPEAAPRTEARTAPPSFAQRHFWSLQQLNPTECFYNVPFGFHLRGKLDATLLRQSFNEIIRRHELLRTTLQPIDGAPMQVVVPTGEADMTIIDLQASPPEAQADEVNRVVQAEVQRPFDLAGESCLRVRLLRLGAEAHILLLCIHNIAVDNRSVSALLKEVTAHYTAFLAGEATTPLPPLPMQYADYARRQQALLSTGMETRLAYWREWFARGEPPSSLLPATTALPAAPTFRAATVWYRLSPERTRRIKSLGQRTGVTLYTTTLAAYAVLIYRHSRSADVVIGTPFANRNHWRLEPLIGSTLDIIALRFDLTGNPDVSTLLARVRETVLAAIAHQDVPFAAIAPILEPDRKRNGPLFRALFSFLEEAPCDQLTLPDVTVTFIKLDNGVMRPDLILAVWEEQATTGAALGGYWQYKQDLYDAEMAAQMIHQFQALLASMADDPTQTLDALSLG
jgi:hypothetical protein